MDTFVNSFRKTTFSSIDQNIFNDFFGRNSHEKYAFDANEFAIPKFEFPACHNPIEFLKAHTDENSKEEHRIKIEHGTTTLAFKFNAGIIVAADSRASAGTYIASKSVKKIIEINPYLLGTMAGGAGDCTFWERELGRRCRLHELRNKERISVAAASKLLTNMIYPYKGMGISMGVMVVGWDKTGPNLFYVDSEGGRLKGDKFSVGSGSPFAYGILDNEHDFDMNTQDALELARRSIFQATYRDGASGGSINLYHVKETGWEFINKYDVNDLHWEYQDQPVKKLL